MVCKSIALRKGTHQHFLPCPNKVIKPFAVQGDPSLFLKCARVWGSENNWNTQIWAIIQL